MAHATAHATRTLRLALAAAAVLLVLGVLCAALWFYSRADLRAAIARVQDAGYASSYDAVQQTLSPLARRQAFERIGPLLPFARALSDSTWTSGTYGPFSLGLDKHQVQIIDYHPGAAIHPALVEYHASLDPAKNQALLAAVDAVGDEPLVLHELVTLKTLMPEYAVWRQVQRYLKERCLIAAPADVGVELKRMVNIARCADGSPSLMSLLVKTSLVLYLQQAAFVHESALRHSPEAPEIIQGLRALAAQLAQDNQAAHRHELVNVVTALQSYTVQKNLMSNDVPPSMLAWRMDRAGSIDQMLKLVQCMESNPNMAYVRRFSGTMELYLAERTIFGQVAHPMASEVLPAVAVVYEKVLNARLICLVLAARLEGSALPEDLLADTPGQALHMLEKDGVVYGCYSVGRNGVDDHGDKMQDLRFEWAPEPAAKP